MVSNGWRLARRVDECDDYLQPPSAQRRHRALDDLFALNAPVADWATLEAEIEAGYRS